MRSSGCEPGNFPVPYVRPDLSQKYRAVFNVTCGMAKKYPSIPDYIEDWTKEPPCIPTIPVSNYSGGPVTDLPVRSEIYNECLEREKIITSPLNFPCKPFFTGITLGEMKKLIIQYPSYPPLEFKVLERGPYPNVGYAQCMKNEEQILRNPKNGKCDDWVGVKNTLTGAWVAYKRDANQKTSCESQLPHSCQDNVCVFDPEGSFANLDDCQTVCRKKDKNVLQSKVNSVLLPASIVAALLILFILLG